MSLPYPACTIREAHCKDPDVVNTLDSFGLQPQLSIPFDGPIDVATVNSGAIFLINLGSALEKGDRFRESSTSIKSCGTPLRTRCTSSPASS